MKHVVATAALALTMTTLSACARNGDVASDTSATTARAANTLTAAERSAGWRLLFDGSSAAQWRGYKSDVLPSGWMVMDGTLMKEKGTGDIVTREQFDDFELAIDWKIEAAGNAGIFYRGNEEYEYIYWTAPEYQLLDDPAARDGRNRLTSAASAYGLYAAPAGILKPTGEWNTTRIVAKGPHIEHWLNGVKVVEYEIGSPDWEAKVQASKFREWPKYGRLTTGHIAVQGDHQGMLALRNIRIRPLH